MTFSVYTAGLVMLVVGVFGAWYNKVKNRPGNTAVFVVMILLGIIMLTLSSLALM
jgi:hydrogenase/urease accessory protein HupE